MSIVAAAASVLTSALTVEAAAGSPLTSIVPAVAVAVNTVAVLLILIVSPAVAMAWVSDETVAAAAVPPLSVGVRLPSVASTNSAEPSAAVMPPELSILMSVDLPPRVTVAE